jgi:uncharacterized protein (TIGR00297 family)
LLKMNDLASIVVIGAAVSAPKLWLAAAITLAFAAFGRLVRGVTTSGAVAGAIVCFALLMGAGWAGFGALCAVFALTWAATRFGYARKLRLGTAEPRGGRTASQVIANLGVSAVCAVAYSLHQDPRILLALGAALAEAAADTVSSEVGQAIGERPRLLTTWDEVSPGTDGAITLAGTAAGLLGALLVSSAYVWSASLGWREGLICASAGLMGTFADSLLGATAERRGMIGNNTVNLCSTLVAAVLGFLLA